MEMTIGRFTLETDNPARGIIRLLHFPSWYEFKTDKLFLQYSIWQPWRTFLCQPGEKENLKTIERSIVCSLP